MRPVLVLLLLLLGATFLVQERSHPNLSGQIVGIADGDTLTLLTADKQQVKIRLYGIDAPEKGQPYGKQARAALSALAFGKEGRALPVDRDKYGRVVAWLFIGDTNVNAELVKQGAAWVYRRYTQDATLLQREREARQDRRGLWALPEAQRVPPWVWREERR